MKIAKRIVAVCAAFAAGWVTYMIAMMMTVYDGLISMIFQPFVAILCSGLCVLLALLVGLILRIPMLSRWWHSSRVWAVALMVISCLVLSLGSSLGITEVYTDHETGRQFTGLHSAAALSGYFVLIFAIANWPFRSRTNVEPDDPHEPPSRASVSDAPDSSDAGFAASDRCRRRSVS